MDRRLLQSDVENPARNVFPDIATFSQSANKLGDCYLVGVASTEQTSEGLLVVAVVQLHHESSFHNENQ